MKILSSVESWNSFFEWASLFTLVLTLIAGTGTILTARLINRRQALAVIGLQKAASEAKEAQQTVEISLSEAKRRQTEAEKDLLELKSKLAFRAIGSENAVRISDSLKKYAPQSFEILMYPDDQECVSFGLEIYRVLTDAGWKVIKSTSWLGFNLELGVRIEFAPSKAAEFGPAAQALAEALSDAGIKSITWGDRPEAEKEFSDRIRVRVGKKP